MPQDNIYYKICGLPTVQRAEKTEIADYKYTAVGETQKRKEGEKMVSEKDEGIRQTHFPMQTNNYSHKHKK